MPNQNTIPDGYMTVGQAAKKMGVTVRTLQYYDKQELLSPAAQSDGGRRLYTDKDLIKLHQILSLKHLGFSLNDIKNHLVNLDSPAEVAQALTKQADSIRQKIEALSESLKNIDMLKAEVLQMQTVNFKQYADIIVNLQMKNEFYWLIKHFDDQTLDQIRSRFDKDSGLAFIDSFLHLWERAIQLQSDGIAPESEAAQELAKSYWEMIIKFTGGDMRMLPKLIEMGQYNNINNDWKQKVAAANAYIEPALGIYFTKLGINPFEEAGK